MPNSTLFSILLSTVMTALLLTSGMLLASDVISAAQPPPQEDSSAALARWYQQASTGDTNAQYELFKIYRSNQGAEHSIKHAIRWLHSAGNSGHLEAQYWLGYIYFLGQGVGRDVDGGMAWYKKSAAGGYVHAQFALGQIYNGWHYRFYPGDATQARHWFSLAAEQGHIQSIFIIGCGHYFGFDQPVDVTAGLAWFQKAAVLGDDTAMASLELKNEDDLRQFCDRVNRI